MHGPGGAKNTHQNQYCFCFVPRKLKLRQIGGMIRYYVSVGGPRDQRTVPHSHRTSGSGFPPCQSGHSTQTHGKDAGANQLFWVSLQRMPTEDLFSIM